MRAFLFVLCICVLLPACGSDKVVVPDPPGDMIEPQDFVPEQTDTGGGVRTPILVPLTAAGARAEMMAREAMSCIQQQAFQSELVTAGFDDNFGSRITVPTQSQSAALDFSTQPTVDFDQPPSAAFNVLLDFNAYTGFKNSTVSGRVDAQVRPGDRYTASVYLGGALEYISLQGNDTVLLSDTNVTVLKRGTRTTGQVERAMRGRALHTWQMGPGNSNTQLHFELVTTTVSDKYISNNLRSREISGRVAVEMVDPNTSALVEFNAAVRKDAHLCLCPTAGSIIVATAEHDVIFAFSGVCGRIDVVQFPSSGRFGTGKIAISSLNGTSSAVKNTSTLTPHTVGKMSPLTPRGIESQIFWANCEPE